MRRQQFIHNPLNRNPLLQQAAVCFNSNFTNTNQSNSPNYNSMHFPLKNHNLPNYSALPNSGSLSGQARNLKFVTLPFYDIKSVSF